MSSSYTSEQMRQALAALGMAGYGDLDPRIVRPIAEQRVREIARGIQLSGQVPDPVYGVTYDPRHAPDRMQVRRLIALRELFEILHPEVPLWPYSERERLKREAWRVLHDKALPEAQRIDAALGVMRAHFARSAWATLRAYTPLSFVLHPGFDEYARHYLHSDPAYLAQCFGEDVAAALLVHYSRPERLHIRPGHSYWQCTAYLAGTGHPHVAQLTGTPSKPAPENQPSKPEGGHA